MKRLAAAIMAMLVVAAAPSAGAVGFQYLSVPEPPPAPSIDIGIWYPSDAPVAPTFLGLLAQTVAVNGEVAGRDLPLIVISHGTGGWFGSHFDTAQALAAAGFVVVAPTHPGDNYKDESANGLRSMIDRPRQIRQVLDYMTESWPARVHLAPSEIGFYGFSAGGFTGLVAIGGIPDWEQFAPHCAEDPPEAVCHQGVAAVLSRPRAATMPAATWEHDPRIKAAVLAAPGFAFAFDPPALAKITIPVQLWGGADDEVVPVASNLAVLQRFLPHVIDAHVVLGADHYSFLAPCTDAMRAQLPAICVDPPGFDRVAFHDMFDKSVAAFFRNQLKPR